VTGTWSFCVIAASSNAFARIGVRRPRSALAPPALASSQPYANVQLGYAHADFPVGPPYNGVVKNSAPVVGIEGGYAFREWSAEIGRNE
jgi:hypothetical protein